MTAPLPPVLALAFCRELRATLTDQQLAEAVALNRHEPDPHVCHTHDFCDANECMSDALLKLRPDWVFDASDQAYANLLNAAWELAHAAEFNPELVSL